MVEAKISKARITADAGTNLDTSLLALESGNLATIAGDTTSIDGKVFTENTFLLFRKLLQMVQGLTVVDSSGRIKINAETGNISTVTTVNSTTTVRDQGSATGSLYNSVKTNWDSGDSAFSQGIRANINVS